MGFLLETATVSDPYARWMVGAVALVILLGLLRIVRGIGKSRPHS